MASLRDRSQKRSGGPCLSFLTMMLMCLMMPAAISQEQQSLLPFHFGPLPNDHVLAHKNKPLQLNCPVTSSLLSGRVSWHFESEDIPAHDPRRILEPDGSLLIKKFLLHRKPKKNSNTTQESVPNRKNDEGRYFCIVRNDVGAVLSRPIHVVGVKLPQVAKDAHVTVVEAGGGSNVRLVCQTNSSFSSSAVEYVWLINNHTITDADKYNPLPQGILQIVNVTKSDASLFTCSMVVKSEVFLVKEWRVVPLPAQDQKSLLNPKFLSPAQNLTHKTKESIVLECLPQRTGDRSNVTWTRISEIPLNQSVDQFGNLHLVDLKLDDSDTYVCNLDQIAITHSLRVIAEPIIVKLPQQMVSPSAQTARFECLAEGFPPPVVRWFRDASPVTLTGRFSVKGEDQTLVISQSVFSDSGVYQCLVENEAGSATAAARLTISAANNQPRPPRIILLLPISSTSVRLQLEPGDGIESPLIKAYTIHYTASGGQELQHVSPNTSVVIENLIPFTNYTFYVRAYGNSASEPSATEFVQTKEDVPVRSPKIQLSAISPTSVRVSWSLLPPAQARGQVTKYEIHYKTRSQTAYHVTDVPDYRVESFVLEDLQPSHRYDVRVLAGTSAGFPKVTDGSLWPWTSIEMPDIDDHILSANFSDAEPESSSITPSLVSVTTTTSELEKGDRIAGIAIIHLLVWIVAGSVISAALVCLCILTLHCRRKSSPVPREERNGNPAFVNGNHLPSMYGDVAEGREMESFLPTTVVATNHKLTETRIDPKQVYVSLK